MGVAYSATSQGGMSVPTGGGAIVSWDAGATWEWAAWGLPVREVNVWGDPVFDSGVALRAYADRVLLGTAGGHVWTSEDQGLNWMDSVGVPSDHTVLEIAQDSTAYYAVTRDSLGIHHLYTSADGFFWGPDALGVPGDGVLSLVDADGSLFVFADGEGELWRKDSSSWHRVAAVPEGLKGMAPVMQYGDVFLVTARERGLLELHPTP